MLRRRIGVGTGDVALGHARELVPMVLALAFVLGLETAVVGLLVPWPIVHVLDVLAVLQVLSVAAVAVTRPHLVGGGRRLLRGGALFEVEVPLTLVESVRAERERHSGAAIQFADKDVPELHIAVGGWTDVVVKLEKAVSVTKPDGTSGMANRVRFRCDDGKNAVTKIRAEAARV
ncbi:hypothetical protein [Saccharopolyspora erythraea]|uniref:hypothetical protein n=1 Tax=Saccharopolyspora erythraea TaxID=1836 RepID=UPI001E3C6E85|nr:hypothetical protein [Saccharopolyspora erythraea]